MRVIAKILRIFRTKKLRLTRIYSEVGGSEGGARPAGAGVEKVLSVCGMNGRTVPTCSNAGVREAELGRMGGEE
jgi:hypothetical protein